MPLFETGIVQVSTVGTLSALIWSPSNGSTSTFGALGSITTGDVLKDVTIINTGSGTVYAAGGTTAAGAAPIGIPIPPGGQLTIQGYNVTAAATVPGGPIYGITRHGCVVVGEGRARFCRIGGVTDAEPSVVSG